MPYSEAQLRRTNGFKPRPPKRWMRKIDPKIKREYPRKNAKQRARIEAGIWHRYPAKTRRRLAKKYGAGPDRRRTKKKASTKRRRWLW